MRAQLALVSFAMFRTAPAFAVSNFTRDADDKGISLTLKQRGPVLQGERH